MIRTTSNNVQYWLGVISAKRFQNVPEMHEKIGEATWIVPKEEVSQYEEMGATVVASNPFPNLVFSRNLALELAFEKGLPCVQTDDDFVRIKRAYGNKTQKEITFDEGVELMINRLTRANLYYGGVAPTHNAFFVGDITSKNLFCSGKLSVTRPCDLRFDANMTLKEDYDFTLQHIAKYGGVVRSNDLLTHYLNYTNKGGVFDIRNTPNEQRNIAYLKRKWGNAIRDNSKRKNEILMNASKIGM